MYLAISIVGAPFPKREYEIADPYPKKEGYIVSLVYLVISTSVFSKTL